MTYSEMHLHRLSRLASYSSSTEKVDDGADACVRVPCPREQWNPRSQDGRVNRLAAPPLVGAKAQARDIT